MSEAIQLRNEDDRTCMLPTLNWVPCGQADLKSYQLQVSVVLHSIDARGYSLRRAPSPTKRSIGAQDYGNIVLMWETHKMWVRAHGMQPMY